MRWLLALLIVLACSAESRAQQPKPVVSIDDWQRLSDLQRMLEYDHQVCTDMAKPAPLPGIKPRPYLQCMRDRGWAKK
jgi:hypothetical protein